VQAALDQAIQRAPDLDPAVLKLIADILRLQFPPDLPAALRTAVLDFIARFQQLSGPATAKGLEDTAFYRYNRFVSLNEVGGNPGKFGTTLDEFHRFNLQHAERWPHS